MAQTKNRKKLSSRLFAAFFLLSLVVFLAATTTVVAMSWMVYEGYAEERLVHQTETTAADLRGMDTEEMKAVLARTTLADTRITLVAPDGTILYDTDADPSTMANHADRKEISSARHGDEIVVHRRSATTGTDTVYAAVAVNDEDVVLRLAETRTSLPYYLRSLFAPLALAALLAAALSAVLARTITRKVVTPLLSVDLDEPLESEAYEEVEPLLSRIATQRSELIGQNEQLEKSMNMRKEFTGNISHEMKSPLQVIGGYAELIESGVAGPEDTKRFASLIRSESHAMRELIDDVLLLSKLDENAFGEPLPIDLSEVCLRAVARLENTTQAHGTEIRTDCPSGMLIFGSQALADQVVCNLLENAIRYGGGLVEVKVARCGENIELSVADNGPGIPDDQKERVFERFYRMDPSRSRETGGTGLGLAIVKHAAQTMGGTSYTEDSELGGARLCIRVPAASA
ncbi:sensor histidine kinase [Slackia heliotrinireducens]|uniref:sensor histidine kinase n=1 Tax=Slackia heliotrinireducens TaxID=84110 RepID=UPI0033155C71